MNPIILYENLFKSGTPTATDTAAGFDVLNIRDPRDFTFWKAASTGTKYLTVDCGVAKRADTFAILGHNFYSVGASVLVETADDLAGPWTARSAPYSPLSDKALLQLFSPVTARCWRLKIVSIGDTPQLAVAMIGSRLEFPFGPTNVPFAPFQESIVADAPVSKGGHLLGVCLSYVPLTLYAEFANPLRSWVYGAFKTFWETHGRKIIPFFWAWDLTVFPDHVFYAIIDPETKQQFPLETSEYVSVLVLSMLALLELPEGP